MKDVLDIYDEVIIKGRATQAIRVVEEVVEKRIRKINRDGIVTVENKIEYKLDNSFATYHPEELQYVGMRAVKEKLIDDIIIDSHLLMGKPENFKFLRQMFNEGNVPDDICPKCKSGMHKAFWDKGVEGLRCMDCGYIKYE